MAILTSLDPGWLVINRFLLSGWFVIPLNHMRCYVLCSSDFLCM
jgi:hypothetical protein